MSSFDAAWLALREPVDARSRAQSLATQLSAWLRSRRPRALRIVDLGCGTGANRRWLAPRLGGEQHWRCIDNDRLLLQGAHAGADEGHITMETVCGNLADDLETLVGEDVDVITASALLDLVSLRWLARLLQLAASRAVPLLFALSYDGRLRFDPPHASDALLQDAVNAHQRRDKGFGVALGPRAAATMEQDLRRRGWSVGVEPSDWVLGLGDAALARELLGGLVTAALEQEPAHAGALRQWESERRTQLQARTLRVEVGHVDLLALPPG